MAPVTPKPIALLACSVFEREIALCTQGAGHIAETRWFEIGLHERPEELRGALQAAIDELARSRADIEAIVLTYGLCGRATVGLHSRAHTLVLPRAHDCITLFMGGKEAYARQRASQPGCYYYTPGWNRKRRVPGPERIESLIAELAPRFDTQEIEFLIEAEREQWAACDMALYVDLGTADADSECAYARRCAEWLGWKFERRRGDPALLRDLIWGPWDEQRFQIVHPGMRLGHAADEDIMRAEPVQDKVAQG